MTAMKNIDSRWNDLVAAQREYTFAIEILRRSPSQWSRDKVKAALHDLNSVRRACETAVKP